MAKHHRIQKDDRNGNYFVRIQLAGTRKYFNLGPQLKEARRALARLEKRVTRGDLSLVADRTGSVEQRAGAPTTTGSDPLLSELIASHLKWVAANRAPATFELYDTYENAFLDFAGDINVSQVTRFMLEEFYAWAKANRGQGPNAGFVFIRHVKTMFLWAEEMDICPCPVRKFPKVTETPPDTMRFTDEEIHQLLNTVAPDGEDFRDMIVFGLHTGLRPQELRQLTRDQLIPDGAGNYSVVIQHHIAVPGKRPLF